MQLSKDQLLTAYRTMRTIREFEERLHIEFATGDIPGFVHLYAGEEASGVGVCMHLDDRDRIASTHRGHGHCIAKGCDVDGMMAEIYGRKDGLCAGKGGSMHIADLDKGMMGANGIVGGGPPLICGAGLAAKQLGTGGVAIAFVGDGGSNQGTTFESLNLASVWNLPCIFVVENNGYAESTSSKWSIACDDAADRASGFNMPGVVVDGHDFFAVHEAAGEAVNRARDGGGPSLLECKLNRYYGHFEGDAQTYRGPDEVKKLRETRDCLAMFREKVTGAGLLDAADLDAIRMDLEAAGFDDAQVLLFGEATDVLVRLPPQQEGNQQEIRRQLQDTLESGAIGVELRRVESVSPQVGGELAEQGGLAMIFALMMIFIYVMFRFQWKFAMGAVAALVHDVIITVGFFSWFGLQFDLTVVAAVLAVIGYSLNDTVVAFDRIRENFFKLRGVEADESMNVSINEMLARTLITGLTTLFVLFALLILGGESIAPFSIALIVGIIVGTYSSIYTASATALLLGVNALDLTDPVKDPELLDDLP